jgi:hypothetical protein
MLGEMMVMEHSIDIQILNSDKTVGISEDPTLLVQEISPLVGDFGMQFSSLLDGFSPVGRALLLSGELPLEPFQSPLALDEESGVFNNIPIGEGGEVLDANIDTNLFIWTRVLFLNTFNLTAKYSEPLPSPISLDGHGLDFALWYSMQHDRDISNFRNMKSFIGFETKPKLRVGYALESFLKTRKSDLDLLASLLFLEPSKKVGIRLGESICTVLQGLRKNGFKLWVRIFNFFDNFAQFYLTIQRNFILIRFLASLKQKVIHLATKIKLGKQAFLLNLGRIQSEFIVSQFHNLFSAGAPYIYLAGEHRKSIQKSKVAIHPIAKAHGLSRNRRR